MPRSSGLCRTAPLLLLLLLLPGPALDPDAPTRDEYTPFGYYLAAGADVASSHQLLARIDRYDPDVPGQTALEHQGTLGYNFFATSGVRVLINYQAPTTDLAAGVITLCLQAALQ